MNQHNFQSLISLIHNDNVLETTNPKFSHIQKGRNSNQLLDITNLSHINTNFSSNLQLETKSITIYCDSEQFSNSSSDNIQRINQSKEYESQTMNSSLKMSIDQTSKKSVSLNTQEQSNMIIEDNNFNTCTFNTSKFNYKIPQQELEYKELILKNYFDSELDNEGICIKFDYFKETQIELNDKMRNILFDWIIDVHLKWKLNSETLYIVLNIIDRFLAKKSCRTDELQCVGVASLFISCKYEEIHFPDSTDFIEITDNAFTKEELLQKEYEILDCLNYELTYPTPLKFFEIFNVYLQLEESDKYSVLYLLELSIFDYSLLKYKSSLKATGCCMLVVSHNNFLKEKLILISKYSPEEIAEFCKNLINVYYKNENGSKSLKRKYSLPRFFEVAKYDLIYHLASKHDY